MTSPLSTMAAVAAAGIWCVLAPCRAGWLAVDYDVGQSAGTVPVGAAAVVPLAQSATTSVTVVSGTANAAGGGAGSGIRVLDQGGSAAGVEYHFVTGAHAERSTLRIDFDAARLGAGSGSGVLAFGAGEFSGSTGLRMNANAQRFFTVELTSDGKANFVSASGPDVTGYLLAPGRSHFTIFVNDRDTQSVTYARPDNGQGEVLGPNRIAYWVDAAPVLTTDLDVSDATATGTVGSTEDNFGRLGFATFSTATGLDWNFDNVSVAEITGPAVGVTRFVRDAAEFNALPALAAGDLVVLRNGAYGGLNKTLSSTVPDDATAQGTPIVVRAETPGGVDVTAPSQILLQGRGIVLAGLDFLPGSGMIDEGTGDATALIHALPHSRYCRLTNLRFFHCTTGDTYGYWVFLNGFQHAVEYCSFEGKDEPNANAVIALKGYLSEGAASVARNHAIRNCYFGPRLCSASQNGYETLRIGDSHSQAIDMRVTVERNLFYRSIWRADGQAPNDPEIISSKSRGNRIRHNTLLESRGQITLRHGDACTVEGNFVFGGGFFSGANILMNPTSDGFQGGIRIIGQNHIVRNNYLVNLRGVNLRAALCLMSGTSVWNDGNGVGGDSGYEPAHHAQIVNNTFIDCEQMNLGYVKEGATAPTGVRIFNNAWQGDAESYGVKRNNDFTAAGAGGNYIYGPNSVGWTGLPNSVYTKTVSPDISQVFNNALIPAAGSLLLNAADPTLVATHDVRNFARPTAGQDIGCHEREVAGNGRKPLFRHDVGPLFDGGPAGTYP